MYEQHVLWCTIHFCKTVTCNDFFNFFIFIAVFTVHPLVKIKPGYLPGI